MGITGRVKDKKAGFPVRKTLIAKAFGINFKNTSLLEIKNIFSRFSSQLLRSGQMLSFVTTKRYPGPAR